MTEKEIVEVEEEKMNTLVKLGGHEFYKQVLKSPKHVVAPMVEHTLLAFRMLCRKYGSHLVYTPMFNSKVFAYDASYRADNFTTCQEDRPLVVQFCGNEVDSIVKSAKLVQDRCDAVDINLGCPQGIARRGNYGAFLLEKPDIVLPMVRALHKELKVPIFCKIRILSTGLEDTIKLALQLQEAGCQLLTVHGRTKEQKGHLLVPADWKAIRAVRDALTIPVIANGSIDTFQDIDPCMEATGAVGVMSAEGILANPAMFSGRTDLKITDVARDYLDLCDQYETPISIIRSHIFKMLKPCMDDYEDLRDHIHGLNDMVSFRLVLDEVDKRVRENKPKVRMLTNKEKRELKAKEDALKLNKEVLQKEEQEINAGMQLLLAE